MALSRIAIVTYSFPPQRAGGIAIANYHLYLLLKKSGYNVKVFVIGPGEKTESENIVFTGGMSNILSLFLYNMIHLWMRFKNINRGAGLFSNYVIGSFSGYFAWPLIRKFDPEIIIVQDFRALSALMPKSRTNKIVFVSHSNSSRFIGEPLIGSGLSADASLAHKCEQMALNKADGAICPSEHMLGIFKKTYRFSKPVEVLPNIVDPVLFTNISQAKLAEQASLKNSDPIVYIPAAGDVVKGSQFVFEIIRRITIEYGDDIGFYLSDTIPDNLKRCLSFLPPSARLIIPGNVPYFENLQNVSACTLCASPCLLESFGMAQLEANFLGLPVVAFDAGGNRDIVESGMTGYLVPFMDIEGFIERCLELLFNLPLRSEMARRARERAQSVFDSEKIISKYIAFFEKIAKT